MRLSMIGAVAAAALLGATSPGIAQGGPEPKGNDAGTSRPQAQPPMPGQPKAERGAPESKPQARPERNAEPRAERPRQDEPKRAQRREDNTPPKETNKSTRTEQPNTEPKSEPRKSSEGRDGKDQRKTTREQTPEQKGQPGKKDAAKQPDGKQTGQPVRQVQANDDQRRGVRERLFRDSKPERVKLDVRVSIGTAIPRRHRLHALPVEIVSYAPVYRGYSYIVVDDEICIVDPQTYVVVDVIPASSTQRADRGSRPTLALSNEQMRFVYANVDRERRVDLRIRLALGAEVPRDVELRRFDGPVLANLPELESYRYVVVDNDVVIVNPDDYAIALVVNE